MIFFIQAIHKLSKPPNKFPLNPHALINELKEKGNNKALDFQKNALPDSN